MVVLESGKRFQPSQCSFADARETGSNYAAFREFRTESSRHGSVQRLLSLRRAMRGVGAHKMESPESRAVVLQKAR
jgi:hypothetical protein